MNGTGYPRGLKDDELEFESKILGVSDVVEAMSSHRPYRAALDIATTKAEIANGSGSLYFPECVDACLELIEDNKDDTRRLFEFLAKPDRNN